MWKSPPSECRIFPLLPRAFVPGPHTLPPLKKRAQPAPREGAFPGPACAGFPYRFTSSAAIRSQPSSSPSSSWGVPTTTWWVHRPGRGSTRPATLGWSRGSRRPKVTARERRARPAPREGAFPGPACAGFPYRFTSSAALRSQPSSSPSSSWGVPTTTWWVHRPGRGSTRPATLGWSRGSPRPKVTVR